MLVDHNGFRYNCDVCEHKSKSEKNLKQHMRLEHNGQKFDCHQCSSFNIGKQEMVVHIKNYHFDIKTHKICTICQRRYKKKIISGTHKKL